MNQAKHLLIEKKVSELVSKKLISTNGDDTLAHALKLLTDNHIQSVPVFDKSEGKFTQFVDLVDFACHIGRIFVENQIIESSVDRMLAEEKHFHVKDITNESNRDPWFTLSESSDLNSALHVMLEKDLHRAAVVDHKDHLIGVVTLTNFLTFLSQQLALFPITQKTVHELQLGYKAKVASIHKSEPAVRAFLLMTSERVSGVAVIDEAGKLVGNISSSDLKEINFNAEIMNKLKQPVQNFLSDMQGQQAEFPRPICVTPTATVEEVTQKMLLAKAHRVYVVDPATAKAIGVISQLDIIKALVHSV